MLDDSVLPTDTALDGPERDPLIDDEMAAVLKAVYLAQLQVPEFRAPGMSDTEIVDTLHELVQAGFVRIVQHGDRVGLVPTEAGGGGTGLELPRGLTPRQQKARAKCRQRRRLFGR